MDTRATERRLRKILPSDLLIAVYNLQWPHIKGESPSGAEIGQFHFKPDTVYLQAFYDLVFHRALVPLSEIPLEDILRIDLTVLLPDTQAMDYPEQSLGLITVLDQARLVCSEYGLRYARAFFDPIAEKLFRQVISQSSKIAWLSRGYSMEDWFVRVLWFWGPAIHSDTFMTQNRQTVNDWLQHIRCELELYAGIEDPLAQYELADDSDFRVLSKLFADGPPQSLTHPGKEATIADYTFWWLRILNTHCAITDFAGRYPFWVRHKGEELCEKDKLYMEAAEGRLLEGGSDALFDVIRRDKLEGKWQPLPSNDAFEHATTSPRRLRPLGERGHGPVAVPRR